MMGVNNFDGGLEFVEVDPSGRYGRYNEILGKGSSKIVYKAFDELEGIEVAWNQVKLCDFMQSPDDLERLYCEIHLLKTLKHKNMMKFYSSWVDTANRNINFVTEMFTSGSLRQYRQKHKRVSVRAVKNWCRQILNGLLYLHSHDPPVIHRDLKCDNIFVNGNQGEVKIGDLGLAAILKKSYAAHCVGTPEFMAPEIYAEEYNELVDIYSFGMCILEMVTFEYPYSECTHPAEIYKKVVSGRKPDALYKVCDPEIRQFVEKCLVAASERVPARELLDDPFLLMDDLAADSRIIEYRESIDRLSTSLASSSSPLCTPKEMMSRPDDLYNDMGMMNGWGCEESDVGFDLDPLFDDAYDDQIDAHLDISIKGKRKNDNSIFMRLRIADSEGRIRNIYFPFDLEVDSAMSVAMEMVAELEISDHCVTKIADMIDGELSELVIEWKPGLSFEETPHCPSCASKNLSNGLPTNYHEGENCTNNEPQHCSCSTHGRFEEFTYQVDDGSEECVTDGAPVVSSSQSGSPHLVDLWAKDGNLEPALHPGKAHNHSDNAGNSYARSFSGKTVYLECSNSGFDERCSTDYDPTQDEGSHCLSDNPSDYDGDEDGRQELRWLRAKYRAEMRGLMEQHCFPKLHSSNSDLPSADGGHSKCNVSGPLANMLPANLHRSHSLLVDAVDSW